MKNYLILFTALIITIVAANAQEIIVKNDGSVINAFRTDYSGQVVYYQLQDSDDAPIFRISKEDILVIRLADGTAITPNTIRTVQETAQSPNSAAQNVNESKFPDIDLTTYHGFLLDKGNCVYVTYNSKVDYEIETVEAIKQSIRENGLWQVVDKPSQAHFVLQYNVCLIGRDLAYIVFRPRKDYEKTPFLDFGWSDRTKDQFFICGMEYASEDISENINVGQTLITHILQNYKEILQSEEFIECVKTGNYKKSKENKENWYVTDCISIRHKASKNAIILLHNYFYIE
ncbi:MAG: hypothetical protein IJS13_06060 [Paludibacteraceae bacterium]|nr:hypothetical protein [Paludibacteraceae bacterium]